MPEVTITLDEYVDLIKAQHTLETLISARKNYTFTFEESGSRVFDAIIAAVCYEKEN